MVTASDRILPVLIDDHFPLNKGKKYIKTLASALVRTNQPLARKVDADF